MNRYFILKKVVEFLGKYLFYFNRLLYCLSYDRKISIIEEVLKCQIISGKYYGKYVSYLIKSSCDENQLQTLEQTVKRNCTLKYNNDTKNWILKVYHKHVVLPKFLPFQYHEDKSHLILGQTLDGICKIKICEIFSNGLIVGASGSGKSCLAQSMIYNALLSGISIWIADLKSSHDYRCFNTKLALNLDDFEVMLDEFIEEVERRLAIDKKHKPLIFFIDELFVVSCLDKKNRDKIMNKLILVMSRCRSANAHIILICQKATSTILDTRIICNVGCKIVLKTSNRQESRNILDGDDRAFYVDNVGRGLLQLDGNNLIPFQSYFIDRKDIKIQKQDENISIKNSTIAQDIEYNENIESSKTLKEKKEFQNKFL